MESVFPTYIFSLTEFSPEGQIQTICKSPGIDAIPPAQPQAWSLTLTLDKSATNATVPAMLKKAGSAVHGGFESFCSGACCQGLMGLPSSSKCS